MTSFSFDGVISERKRKYRRAIEVLKKRRDKRQPLGQVVNGVAPKQQQQDVITIDSSEDEVDFEPVKPVKKRRFFIKRAASPISVASDDEEVIQAEQPLKSLSERAKSPKTVSRSTGTVSPSGKAAWLADFASDMIDPMKDDKHKDKDVRSAGSAPRSKKKRDRSKIWKQIMDPTVYVTETDTEDGSVIVRYNHPTWPTWHHSEDQCYLFRPGKPSEKIHAFASDDEMGGIESESDSVFTTTNCFIPIRPDGDSTVRSLRRASSVAADDMALDHEAESVAEHDDIASVAECDQAETVHHDSSQHSGEHESNRDQSVSDEADWTDNDQAASVSKDDSDDDADSSAEVDVETSSMVGLDDDEDSDFLALKSKNEDHVPGSFNSHFLTPELCAKQLKRFEVRAPNGTIKLDKIGHSLLDPDILFMKDSVAGTYKNSKSYAALRKRYSRPQLVAFNIRQAKRQALIFHHLYHKEAYTIEELEAKLEPYITGGFPFFNRVLGHAMPKNVKKKLCGTSYDIQKKSTADCAKIFVQYSTSTSEEELAVIAAAAGGVGIKEFIRKLRNWSIDSGEASPFVKSIGPKLPRVPYPAKMENPAVTAKNRKDHELRTAQIYDRYTVSKRAEFHHALMHRETREERLALLESYGHRRNARILSSFLSLMPDGLHSWVTRNMSQHNVVSVLLDVLTLPLDVELGKYKHRSLFNTEQWAEVKKIKSKAGKITSVKVKLKGSSKAGRAAVSLRSYFLAKARAALIRQNGKTPTKSEAEKLAAHLLHLYLASKNCAICKAVMPILAGTGSHWYNCNVDRICPGARGGKYVPKNVQLICGGCNSAKDWHSRDQAISIIYDLACASWTIGDDNLLNTPIANVQPIASNAEKKLIERWMVVKLDSAKYSRKQKAKKPKVRLTRSELLKLARKHYVGNGEFQDCTGFRGPTHLFGIDRIDSNGAYEIGNIRLLLYGMNYIKLDQDDDTEVIAYLTHLKKNKRHIAKLVKKGVSLPLKNTTAKLLNDEKDAVAEMEQAEACHRKHNGDREAQK